MPKMQSRLPKLTQNSRLLAGAYIARGSIAANEFFEDWEAAKHYVALAGEMIGKDDVDHLSKQLSSSEDAHSSRDGYRRDASRLV